MQTDETTTIPKFSIDQSAGVYEAISYGPTWNGWATPVVTRETLETIISTEDPGGEYTKLTFTEDGIATITDLQEFSEDIEPCVITPDERGGYDLADLGWTFDTVDTDA